MEHEMKLQPAPFEKIRRGEKTVELRLYDEKRKTVAVGDSIRFIKVDSPTETLTARVVELLVFPSFAELYAAVSLRDCGYSEYELANASPDDMDAYYSREEREKYGVVGIRLELIES
jgi:ASC-1-like (ASCH) protein